MPTTHFLSQENGKFAIYLRQLAKIKLECYILYHTMVYGNHATKCRKTCEKQVQQKKKWRKKMSTCPTAGDIAACDNVTRAYP